MTAEDQFSALTRIVQSAALEDTAEDQIKHILDKLSEALAVDVCSLYRLQADGSLVLVASHGLSHKHPIILPAGEGLVGHIVREKKRLNISEPANHPDYFYVPRSKEEKLHSFCGVPILLRGDVHGALVVQSKSPKVLNSNQEALLSTLAAHLGLLVSTINTQSDAQASGSVRKGISGSGGLAIGRVHIVDTLDLKDVTKEAADDTKSCFSSWAELKQKALDELATEKRLVESELGNGLASVIDAYKLMLTDPNFESLVLNEIKAGWSLPWAIKTAVSQLSTAFKAMEDPYLQARHEDVEHLGTQLYELWRGYESAEVSPSQKPFVLVGRSISVSSIAKLYTKKLAAIVCLEGAALSHIAVLANALGIPAVMGVGPLPLQQGSEIIVDGDNAHVIANPDEGLISEYKKIIGDRKAATKDLLKNIDQLAETVDHQRVELMANSGLQSDIAPGLKYGAEGIGLYRTELPFMISPSLPSEDEQYATYKHVLETYRGKPVYIRALDIGSDKNLPYLPALEEENPALGLRGVRFLLDNSPLFLTQMRAMLRANAETKNLHLLFPMIGSTEQLDACISYVDSLIADAKQEGVILPRPKVGIMLEVPSSISLLPFWADRIDFISIGTNDLSQYLLALDRNNPLVGKWFEPLNPALLHELVRVSKICNKHGIDFSICGELAANPLALVYVVAMGTPHLSMSATKIPLIKNILLRMNAGDARKVLKKALKCERGEDIRQLSIKYLESLHLAFQELLFPSAEGTEEKLD